MFSTAACMSAERVVRLSTIVRRNFARIAAGRVSIKRYMEPLLAYPILLLEWLVLKSFALIAKVILDMSSKGKRTRKRILAIASTPRRSNSFQPPRTSRRFCFSQLRNLSHHPLPYGSKFATSIGLRLMPERVESQLLLQTNWEVEIWKL